MGTAPLPTPLLAIIQTFSSSPNTCLVCKINKNNIKYARNKTEQVVAKYVTGGMLYLFIYLFCYLILILIIYNIRHTLYKAGASHRDYTPLMGSLCKGGGHSPQLALAYSYR